MNNNRVHMERKANERTFQQKVDNTDMNRVTLCGTPLGYAAPPPTRAMEAVTCLTCRKRIMIKNRWRVPIPGETEDWSVVPPVEIEDWRKLVQQGVQ